MTRFFSSSGWHRDGWVEISSGVGVPIEAVTDGPSVQWNHIDGPVMHWGGTMDWLTWRECFAIWFRRKTVDEVASARWPHLAKIRETIVSGTA